VSYRRAGQAARGGKLGPTRIIAEIHVFDAKRTNGRDLRDVLTRLCPVEMGRVTRENDDAMGASHREHFTRQVYHWPTTSVYP